MDADRRYAVSLTNYHSPSQVTSLILGVLELPPGSDLVDFQDFVKSLADFFAEHSISKARRND